MACWVAGCYPLQAGLIDPVEEGVAGCVPLEAGCGVSG